MTERNESNRLEIEMPAPTGWPMVLAAGATLLAAGLVTHPAISALGLLLFLFAGRGWLRELRPGAGETTVDVVPAEEPSIELVSRRIESPKPGTFGHRLRLPEKVHPYSAGVRGGLAGGAAMAAVALVYGLSSERGVWYPVNLLAAMILPSFAVDDVKQLEAFSQSGLIAAIAIHLAASLGVGLIYGVLLPMLGGRPYLWGGLVAPFLWSGAVHSVLGVVNPVMAKYVNWPWFVASQIAFGVVAGLVVTLTEKVPSEPGRVVRGEP